MPVGMTHDIQIGGGGFMLAAMPGAWNRSGQSNSPSRRSAEDTKYGTLPDEIDHPEVWNDWSGGYGDAYRQPDRLNTYHWSEGFDARWPGQLCHAQQLQQLPDSRYSGPNARVDAFLEVPGFGTDANRAIGAGQVVTAGVNGVAWLSPTGLAAAGSMFDVGIYEGGPIAWGHRAAIWGSYAYIGVTGVLPSGSAVYPATLQLDAQFVGDITPVPGYGFTVAGNRFWRAFGPPGSRRAYFLKNTAIVRPDLLASEGNWGATYNIGSGQAEIKDLISCQDQVFAGTVEGLYAGDTTGTFYNVLTELANQKNDDNCRDLAIFGGEVVVPHVSGLFAFQPSQQPGARGLVREIGPAARLSNTSPVKGYPRCVTNLGPWLYAGYWTGSQSYIVAGRDTADGQTPIWHTMQRIPGTEKISRLHFDGITTSSGGVRAVPNRLWIATDASAPPGGTGPIFVSPVPLNNDNPLASQVAFSANYLGSARMDLPGTNWQAPGTPKTMRLVEVWAENLASGAQYADIYYTMDNGTRTLLGRAQTSPLSNLYFPTEDTGGSFVTGQSIALSIESFTASFNVSPVYRSIVLHGVLRPGAAEIITAQIGLADETQDRNGTPMRPAANQLAELRTYADGVTPRRLIDVSGAVNWVAVLQPVEETIVYRQGTKYPELVAVVKMAVLKFSGG